MGNLSRAAGATDLRCDINQDALDNKGTVTGKSGQDVLETIFQIRIGHRRFSPIAQKSSAVQVMIELFCEDS
jgi:hypothetical protein